MFQGSLKKFFTALKNSDVNVLKKNNNNYTINMGEMTLKKLL